MSRFKLFLTIACALALGACSPGFGQAGQPSGTPGPQLIELVGLATHIVETAQAQSRAQTQEALLATLTPIATRGPAPRLSVSLATDCFAGPSTNYGFVITVHPGTTVSVVGKDPADNYWIIDVPGYPGTLCWLSGQYAEVSGDILNLAEPATPQASIYTLGEPRNLRVSCSVESGSPDPDSDADWVIVLRWKNTDPDQTGVRVLRSNRVVATLGPNATSYSETLSPGAHRKKRGLTYGVQAFNRTRVSSIVTIDLKRCG